MEPKHFKKKLAEIQKLKETILEKGVEEVEGRLHCHMSMGKHPQFYLLNEEICKKHPKGRYIRKNELETARKLAQRDYHHSMLKILGQNEKALQQMIEKYDELALREAYDNLPQARKKLVEPYILPDQEFLDQWMKCHPQEQNMYPKQNTYETEHGEIVRSKSEKMIADKLFYRGIPYAYETKLLLAGGRVIYPDFTLLNVRTRQTFFLEHCGLMDDPEYCKNMIEKVERYEQNGIFLGEKLLLTMESSLKNFNVKNIDSLIERYLV